MDAIVTKTAARPGMLAWEAAGLAWLHEADGARIVEVVRTEDARLDLVRVRSVPATPPAARAFGAALALTHRCGAPAFGCGPTGWSGDGFIGEADLPLGAFDDWGRFYAELRLLPYARLAHSRGDLPELARIEKLCERLLSGVFDDGLPPARLHGDLWAGNVLFGPEGVVLIDPAAHGGHPVTDLAMLALFGAPHLSEILDGYQASADLPAGWRRLIGLHQLHPLLVHAVLFGGGYGHRAVQVARGYL